MRLTYVVLIGAILTNSHTKTMTSETPEDLNERLSTRASKFVFSFSREWLDGMILHRIAYNGNLKAFKSLVNPPLFLSKLQFLKLLETHVIIPQDVNDEDAMNEALSRTIINPIGMSPVQLAVIFDHLELLQLMFERFPELDINERDAQNRSLSDLAKHYGNHNIVRYLEFLQLHRARPLGTYSINPTDQEDDPHKPLLKLRHHTPLGHSLHEEADIATRTYFCSGCVVL